MKRRDNLNCSFKVQLQLAFEIEKLGLVARQGLEAEKVGRWSSSSVKDKSSAKRKEGAS